MSDPSLRYDAVEEFLAQQWNKLKEDKKILDDILNHLEEKQQNFSNIEDGLKRKNKDIQIKCESYKILTSKENNITTNGEKFTENCKTPTKNYLHFGEEYNKLIYNSQSEKERLAYLFENSPYIFGCSKSFRNKRNGLENYDKPLDNKENVNPKYDCLKQDVLYPTPTSGKLNQKDEEPHIMVRYGEFSPLNPVFRGSDNKPLLGLGEYEERRKIFLEKKKREYHEYLNNAKLYRSKMNQKNSERVETVHKNVCAIRETSGSVLQESSSFHDLCSPKGRSEVSTFTKWQQETYRKALDKQVEEKKKIQKEQNDKEKRECQNYELQDITQRRNLTKSIENEFQRRINSYNSSNETLVPQTSSTFITHMDERYSCNELDSRVSSRLKSPILKHTTETCAVDNFDTYQKTQAKLYHRELEKQIEEKRKAEELHKLKELEEEKKIDAKIQKEEEKLRLNYEKEQAEKEYRVSQKIQLEEQFRENLRKIQKANEEKKNALRIKPIPKSSNIYPTNHGFIEKNSTKNVSFAPQAIVHTINNKNEPQKYISGSLPRKTEVNCEYDPMIIQAPYFLAVNDIFNQSQSVNSCINSKQEVTRSPSPILPAVRTRNLLKAIPKVDNSAIPSGVSMSKEARNQYMRDDNILSNLPEIRRKLLQNQSKVHTE